MKKMTVFVGGIFALTMSAPGFAAPPTLSSEAAATLVKPYYDALMAPTPATVRSKAEAVTTSTWKNCTDEDLCETREAAITRWSGLRKIIPDFRIKVREVLVSGNKVIVRSEMTGTPVGNSFMGVDPRGRSYRIMATDIHDIVGDKIAHSYHLEDWGRGINQLRGETSGRLAE